MKFNLQMKKKSKKRKKLFFKIIYYICQNNICYASKCFQFSKNAKMKIDVNVVETTKKKIVKNKIHRLSKTTNK